MNAFTHLNVHSHYSILESTATPGDLINAAVADGQTSLALTDSGNMFGALEFYKACKWSEKPIKPIIGMRAYIAPESRFDKTKTSGKRNLFQILLLAKNYNGYKNLSKLSTIGYSEGFYYKPRIDKDLLKEYKDDIICLSSGFGGEIGSSLMKQDFITAQKSVEFYKEIFGDDFYIELHNHNLPESKELLEYSIDIAKKNNVQLVATNNVHYVHTDYSKGDKKQPSIDLKYNNQDHAVGQNVLMYIQNANASNSGTFDIHNLKFGSDEYNLKTQEQMIELFKDIPEAIENTNKIADQCNIEFDLKTNHMPKFPIPETSKSENLEQYLEELVYIGLNERFPEGIPDNYKKRADYEIGVINTMGFPGYFLIVWDFIKAARDRGVSVGPGRGSAAGSVVAYALEITNVDPIKYDLLFERFLNPERVSMPDVDIDFNDEKRDVVIDYVKQKYGEDAVAQIITFGKLTSKAALTDVGRVLGVELSKIKEITKQIPTVFGKVHTIKMAIALPELKWLGDIVERGNKDGIETLSDEDQKLFELIKYALIVENKVRNTGIHAAGVVIAPSALNEFVPLYKTSKDKESSIDIATQFAMNDLEDAGLLKMDFLGLKTLSIIDKTIDLMKMNHTDITNEFDIEEIPLDDQKTYDLFSNGETLSVFQFESSGMQEYLKKLKPQNLEEITAMNALYRPGPMENIPEFIDRKFGRKEIKYLHPSMEDSLKTTYGIIVYQEQVMKLVQDVAGFSLGQADLLRRAMGKKKIKEMEKMMPIFKEGAKKLHDINEKLAEEIFELINKFANYGFNKSHSLAYSYLAYQTAWLKAHYPAEFLAANFTAEINDQDKIVDLRDNAKRLGIKVLPPDVNRSDAEFTVKKGEIYFGMAAIRNVGIPAVQSIMKAREEQKFTDFYDFAARVDNRLINKRTLEALICAGAFDSLGHKNRNALMHSVDLALDYAKSLEQQNVMQIDSLFGGDDSNASKPKLADMKDWTETKRLEMEKDVLNFYVSGHPLFKYEVYVESLPTINTKSRQSNGNEEMICGLVTSVRKRLDRKDKTIAFVELEDMHGKCEVIFWSNTFAEYGDLIKQDDILFVEGKVQVNEDDDKIKIVAERVLEIDEAIEEYSTGYALWLNEENKENTEKLNQIKEKYEKGENGRFLAFQIYNDAKDLKTAYISKNVKLEPNHVTTSELVSIFGIQNVRFLKYN